MVIKPLPWNFLPDLLYKIVALGEKTEKRQKRLLRLGEKLTSISGVGSWNVDKWKNLKCVALSGHLSKYQCFVAMLESRGVNVLLCDTEKEFATSYAFPYLQKSKTKTNRKPKNITHVFMWRLVIFINASPKKEL